MKTEQIKNLFDMSMDELTERKKDFLRCADMCEDVLKLRKKAGEKTSQQMKREKKKIERPITQDRPEHHE